MDLIFFKFFVGIVVGMTGQLGGPQTPPPPPGIPGTPPADSKLGNGCPQLHKPSDSDIDPACTTQIGEDAKKCPTAKIICKKNKDCPEFILPQSQDGCR